ncbi:hypothetical protein KXD40_003326 [Peronospora effusa]|uniref:RxLR effector protein n=1 Tax=Peronospora effusa TaxID=542832 RepID=A0A3M6VJH9_9STRA|nr:hypothetical protein DD238_002375 [Peronospora effusa]UIZ29919.1 hypothetical protein KXD40_003326 [Peronospora effusa]
MRLLLSVYVVVCVVLRANASYPVTLEATKTSEPDLLTAKNNEQDARNLRRTDDKLITTEEERVLPPSHDMVNIPLVESHSIPSVEASSSNSILSLNSLTRLPSVDSIKVAFLDKAVGMVDVSKNELPFMTTVIFTIFKALKVTPFQLFWRHSFNEKWMQVATTYEGWLKADRYKKIEANGKDLNV